MIAARRLRQPTAALVLAAAPGERRRFASDLLNLTLAAPEINRCGGGKCGRDAAEWQPGRNRCWFAGRVVTVKRKYRLAVDRREAEALDRILRRCASTRMEFTAPGRGRAGCLRSSNFAALPPRCPGRYDDNRNGRIACAEARRHGIAPSAADIQPTDSCTTATATAWSANSPDPRRPGRFGRPPRMVHAVGAGGSYRCGRPRGRVLLRGTRAVETWLRRQAGTGRQPMAKGGTSAAERIESLIAEIEADAYARGRADMGKELLEILGAAESAETRGGSARGRRQTKAAPKRRTGGRKRAPKGSVPRFVKRVLSAHPGSTAAEIPGRAADEVERSIKLASNRVELGNGRAQGRYVSDGRRWSLVVAAESPARPEEAGPSDPSPAPAQGADEAEGGRPEQDGGAVDSAPEEEETTRTLGLNL